MKKKQIKKNYGSQEPSVTQKNKKKNKSDSNVLNYDKLISRKNDARRKKNEHSKQNRNNNTSKAKEKKNHKNQQNKKPKTKAFLRKKNTLHHLSLTKTLKKSFL
jgi:hypothetical protein